MERVLATFFTSVDLTGVERFGKVAEGDSESKGEEVEAGRVALEKSGSEGAG